MQREHLHKMVILLRKVLFQELLLKELLLQEALLREALLREALLSEALLREALLSETLLKEALPTIFQIKLIVLSPNFTLFRLDSLLIILAFHLFYQAKLLVIEFLLNRWPIWLFDTLPLFN